jgi:predicted nucleic acid-binding protein
LIREAETPTQGEVLDERLAAPELIDLEVLSILRRAARAKRLDERRSGQALEDLDALPLQRVSHLPG